MSDDNALPNDRPSAIQTLPLPDDGIGDPDGLPKSKVVVYTDPALVPRSRPAGQNGFNPCVCFAWLCQGKCTLREGCALIGGIHLVIGIIFIIGIFTEVSYLSPGNAFGKVGTETKPLDEGKEFPMAVKVFGPICVSVGPGLLLIIAATLLSKILSLVTMGVLVLSKLLYLVGAAYLTILVRSERIVIRSAKSEDQDSAKASFLTVIWSTVVALFLFYIYSVLCAFGLYNQILHGEYRIPKKASRV